MKCPNCGKENEDNSRFCASCGKSLEKNVSEDRTDDAVTPKVVQPLEKKKNAKRGTIILAIVATLLAVSLAGTIIYYEHECNIIIGRYNDLKEKYEGSQSELAIVKSSLTEKDATISSQKKELEKLKIEKDELRSQTSQDGIRQTQLSNYLSKAGTTNGIITTKNMIYAVKKNASIQIDVTWNRDQIVYLYPGSDAISAEWTKDSNVIVRGERPGISYILFSSSKYGDKDQLQVVVICYE